MSLHTGLILHNDVSAKAEQLVQSNPGVQFVTRLVDEFLIEDAKFAVEKAYVSSEEQKVILLGAQKFSQIAQNKLLKIIEEPPKNITFILLTPTKNTILPTIRSRLPIYNELQKRQGKQGVDMARFDLGTLYELLQESKGIKPFEAKAVMEQMVKDAMQSNQYRFKQSDYKSIEECIKLLDLGSPAIVLLNTVGLKLLDIKNRK